MAKSVIMKSSQRSYFSHELKILEQKGILNKKSSIYKVDSYLDVAYWELVVKFRSMP